MLDEIEARYSAASPGPWTGYDINTPRPGIYGTVRDANNEHIMGAIGIEDALFIAEARNAVPVLVERVRELEESLAWVSGHDRSGLDHLEEMMAASLERDAAEKRVRKLEAGLRGVAQHLKACQSRADVLHERGDLSTVLNGVRLLAERYAAGVDE